MHKFEDHFFLISPLLVNLNPTLKDKVSVVAAQCPAMLQVHLLLNILACNGLKSEVKPICHDIAKCHKTFNEQIWERINVLNALISILVRNCNPRQAMLYAHYHLHLQAYVKTFQD